MSEDSAVLSGGSGSGDGQSKVVDSVPQSLPAKPLWERLTDPFNNVWLGIWLLFLIFLYMTIGSAGIVYPTAGNIFDQRNWVHFWPREWSWIEKTELGFFNWWPFTLLMGLFAFNLTIVTMRRIAFKWINAGVITIHFGILVLCAGSLYYFATKVEGDAVVHRRMALIETPDGRRGTLLISPDAQTRVGQYIFRVSDTNPSWPLRTEGHEGESAYSAFINVTGPGQSFTRQLLDGYPQFTEDIVPGQGRAIKLVGKSLIDEDLSITLDYAPTTWFSVQHTAAVFVRAKGAEFWHERPIDDLPRHNEYIASREWVWPFNLNDKFPLKLLNREARTRSDDPFQNVNVRVTGYLPYARMSGMNVHGGVLNPYARLRLGFEDGGRMTEDRSQVYELYAFDPMRNTASEGRLQFVWVNSANELNAFASPVEEGRLVVNIPGQDHQQEVRLLELAPRGTDRKPAVKLGQTGFSIRIDSVLDDFSIPTGQGQTKNVSVAIVEITKPDGTTLRRFATDQPAMAKDVLDDHGMSDPDPSVEVLYKPGHDLRLTLASGPGDIGTHLYLAIGGEVLHSELQIGRPTVIGGSMRAELIDIIADARYEERPYIVPRKERERLQSAQQTYAMMRVEVSTQGWAESHWLPFHRHAFENQQYTLRFQYQPTTIRLPTGDMIELMFARQQMPLPAAVTLKSFHFDTHEGGLIGMNSNIENYYSDLMFYDGETGQWIDEQQIRVNDPGDHNGFRFFQSSWDPPVASAGHAGMNYTGLGISNRNYSVHIQLLGCCIAVTGMLYAFLVKPIIRRRNLERLPSSHAGSALGDRSAMGPELGQIYERTEDEAVVVR
jgi:hypothetical protein